MITNADITIYRRAIPTQNAASYLRTVICGVSWYCKHVVNASSSGLSGGNVFKIRIPEEATVKGISAFGSYVSPDDFVLSENPSGKWTVDNGDYFCLGVGPDIEKPSDLAKNRLRYGQVYSWGDNRRGGLPHIRIEGW